MNPARVSSALLSLTLLTGSPACSEPADPQATGDEPAPDDPAPVDPADYLPGLDDEYARAAEEFDVPVALLKAIGYVETQWQMVIGEAEFDGEHPAFGVMALRGDTLRRGAELLAVDEDAVKHDREHNIRAAAALLSSLADEQPIDRTDLGAWAPAAAALSGIDLPEAASSHIHDHVYALIQRGLELTDSEGNVLIAIAPEPDVVPDYEPPPVPRAKLAVVSHPSPHYDDRPAGDRGRIRLIVIHTCEGSYAGCWATFAKPFLNAAGEWVRVSAHYVINADGTEISEVVADDKRARHVKATYEPALNSGNLPELAGVSVNDFSIGIEHAGYASQSHWNPDMLDLSAMYACYIALNHDIPLDRYHIVGHGQLQPNNRTDPGAYWPWATYLQQVQNACECVPSEVCSCVPLSDDSCLPGDPRFPDDHDF